jgi:hypothetical protein
LKEVPSASATTTPKCPEYICPEPSILVRERFCYWNETIPAKARCQEGDIYNQDENEKVCVKFYIPQNGTSGTYICKEGFRFVIHEENPYCIQKYEPNFSNCPEGFRYHIDEKTGAELCSKVTDAICVYSHQTTSSTQTPKPTPRCTDPKNPRCIKPDSILNELAPNAALSPLPSRRPIATLLAIVSRLPLPSPFVKPETTMVASDIPIYIPSRISIPQIDSSLVDKPQKVQEIQATLACTLRLPLEKVRINKIAFVNISTGDRRLALIDPTLYLLDSAGSVECYSFSSSDQTRSLQSAKSSNDEKVEIDYFIVNPPVEIITMNQTEFTEVLRQSPVLKTLVQSIGGDSKDISSAVMFENYAAAAVVGPSPSPLVARDSSSSFNFPAYGIGILGAAGGLVAIIAIMVVLGKRRARSFDAFTSSAPPMPTTANPVFVVTNQQYGHYGRGVAKESFPPTYSSV